MKNISERENRDELEGFYRLLYELKDEELRETQLVLVDKGFAAPEPGKGFTMRERHMRPGDKANPPLITYYEDK